MLKTIITLLPKYILVKLKSRYAQRVILATALLLLIYLLTSIPSQSKVWKKHELGTHPIEQLIVNNHRNYAAIISRQSRSLEQAVKEYELRYKHRPPLGFDTWYLFAKYHGFVLIDEFDTIMKSFLPLLKICPSTLKQRIEEVTKSESHCLLRLKIENGKLETPQNFSSPKISILNPTWLSYMPYNMTFLVNTCDEALVNIPFKDLTELSSRARNRNIIDCYHGEDHPLRLVNQSVEDIIHRSCQTLSSTYQDLSNAPQFVTAPSFVSDSFESKDVCTHPRLRQQNGFFVGHRNITIIPELVPIFTYSRPTNFLDILVPSTHYVTSRSTFTQIDNIQWTSKKNKAYWAGSTTGGLSEDHNWRSMQRQRLTLKAMSDVDESTMIYKMDDPNIPLWNLHNTSVAEFSDQLDFKITNVIQCLPSACEIQCQKFDACKDENFEPTNTSFAYKVALDVDGNSYSGRFYRLLKSGSLVIKQTIFEEWHDDRLFPWVHYIPVSSSFDELPELINFFLNTEPGSELAKEIATDSSIWHDKALRDIDILLVWIRILLEYGRLFQPDLTY